MKKSILTLIITILSVTNAFSQISEVPESKSTTIGKVGSVYKSVALTKLKIDQKSIGANEGLYLLHYKNLEYPELSEYASVSFTSTQEDLDYLYNTLTEMCNSTIGTTKTLILGTATLYLRNLGLKQVKISVSQSGEIDSWTWLSRKQVNKLFGK